MQYSIARNIINLDLPRETARQLLPNMEPFALEAPNGQEPLCCIRVVQEPAQAVPADAPCIDDYVSDMGRVRVFAVDAGYAIVVADALGSVARIDVDVAFSKATVALSELHGSLLSASIRIIFSQAITAHRAFALHASCVVDGGHAFLFCAASGAGKSTQARLWRAARPEAWLLNDDCVVLTAEPDGSLRAWGSPWSGKKPCYLAQSAPVAAITRLRRTDSPKREEKHKGIKEESIKGCHEAIRQGGQEESNGENCYQPLTGVEAFSAVIPGCSALRGRGPYFQAVCDTLLGALPSLAIGVLSSAVASVSSALCLATLTGRGGAPATLKGKDSAPALTKRDSSPAEANAPALPRPDGSIACSPASPAIASESATNKLKSPCKQ